MEITKREVLISIIIICIMLIFGGMIHQRICTAVTEKNKEYELAIQINDTDTFKYGMKTNIGNAFVYGELIAIDPVTNPELDGEWMWIQKIKERYTKHTRTVTVKENGKTKTKTEEYWTWDRVGSEEWHSKKVKFLNEEFSYNLITDVDYEYIKTDRIGYTRYKWYASKIKHKGTIYTYLANNTISRASFTDNKNIQETFDSMVINMTISLVFFWIIWIVLIIIL